MVPVPIAIIKQAYMLLMESLVSNVQQYQIASHVLIQQSALNVMMITFWIYKLTNVLLHAHQIQNNLTIITLINVDSINSISQHLVQYLWS
jgi:hypothetical protein